MARELGPRAGSAYCHLRAQLDNGTLAPGARLPAQGDLARSLGVAVLTLRQAVARLVEEGLLVVRRGRGTFVAEGDGHPPIVDSWHRPIDGLQQLSRPALDSGREEMMGLRGREGRFRHTADLAAVGIAHSNLSGRWLYANPRLCEIYGYTRDELFTISFQDITHPADLEADLAQMGRLIAGEIESYEMEKRFIRKDGTTIWGRISLSLVRDAAGRPDYTVAIVDEITDRKRADDALRESETRFRTVFSRSPMGIQIFDMEGCLVMSNEAALDMLGYTEEELRRVHWTELTHPDDWAQEAEGDELIISGQVDHYQLELRQKRKDGTYIWTRQTVVEVFHEGTAQYCIALIEDINERRLAEARYQRLVEQLPAVVALNALDDRSHHLYLSPHIETLLGYTREEFDRDRDLWIDLLHPDDRERVLAEVERTTRTREPFDMDYRMIARDGRVLWLHDDEVVVRDDVGQPMFWQSLIFDVTAQHQTRQQLEMAEQRFRTLVEELPVAAYLARLDDNASVLYVSPRIEELLGYRQEHWVSNPWTWPEIIHPDDHTRVQAAHRQHLATHEPFSCEYRIRREDDAYIWIQDEAVVTYDDAGNPFQQGVLIDVTARRQAEERLAHQAMHDGLTGLPNRSLLADRLKGMVATAQRQSVPGALLLLDLDRFKEVNDTLGHHAGDLLLQEAARRLQGLLRESDTVARLGGDEFAVVLPNTDEAGAALVATKVIDALGRPYAIERKQVLSAASVGIALCPAHGSDGSTLMRRADVAMYDAKRKRLGLSFYNPAQDMVASTRLSLTTELREAIEGGVLALHFQPRIRLAGGIADGAEALARWPQPSGGAIPPSRFIPLAEETGLIEPLSHWVIGQALSQVALWRDDYMPTSVAVNLSARNLEDPTLPHRIERIAADLGVLPSVLTVEITESALMAEPDRAAAVLAHLHDLGVRIAIDDFGTGYSSLAYLKHLPIDAIKIDRSFVLDMLCSERDLAIVRSVADLGRNLGLEVVAEGVETEEALAALEALGCTHVQGFHLCPPLPPPEFNTWWEQRGGERALDRDDYPVLRPA